MAEPSREFTLRCPMPLETHATVQMAHGGGGRLMRRLIEELFLPGFGSDAAENPPHDSAVLDVPAGRLAFTTDTFVVSPLEFPGGDIGRLAIFGTVNDLAMAGAKPLALSAGFVLEEGLPIEMLRRVVDSMRRAADGAGVGIQLREASIPISAPVAGACELLELDPLYVANEGRLVAFVLAQAAERTLEIMRAHPAAPEPAVIGAVTAEHPGTVELRNALGGSRVVDLLSGEQMPRIC